MNWEVLNMKLTSTQRIERTVLSLTMALKAAVYRQNDDSLMAVIAEKNGFNINTFRSSLNPTTPTHKPNIYHLEAVLSETQMVELWTAFVPFMAMQLGLNYLNLNN
jgi:hypothetical protein